MMFKIKGKFSEFYSRFKSYKRTNMQEHMHDYKCDPQTIARRKENVDINFLQQMEGDFTFRQFRFIEPRNQNLISADTALLHSHGRWTLDEIMRQSDIKNNLTDTEEQNKEIQKQYAQPLEQIISGYFQSVGKKGEKFILKEQIEKISTMTTNEFNHFLNILKVIKKKNTQKQEHSEQLMCEIPKLPQIPYTFTYKAPVEIISMAEAQQKIKELQERYKLKEEAEFKQKIIKKQIKTQFEIQRDKRQLAFQQKKKKTAMEEQFVTKTNKSQEAELNEKERKKIEKKQKKLKAKLEKKAQKQKQLKQKNEENPKDKRMKKK